VRALSTEAIVRAYVTEHLEAGETLPSQAALVKRFGVPKQTVSRWMGRWEAMGLLSRTRDGRRNVISSTR
jgi:DNA-binding FadR family transcriptional regulator